MSFYSSHTTILPNELRSGAGSITFRVSQTSNFSLIIMLLHYSKKKLQMALYLKLISTILKIGQTSMIVLIKD